MSGNTEEDWRIFDILCEDILDTSCPNHSTEHLSHSLDLASNLRSELAALSYKRDRLLTELTETKSALCAKETECETLRAQTARQSSLIGSLQSRLQASESRERSVQTRCDSTVETLRREKRSIEEKHKELLAKLRCLEVDVANEESHKEQAQNQLNELMRKLCHYFNIEFCEPIHLTPDCIVTKAGEIVGELQRLKTKVASTCDALTNCESELLSLKSVSNVERQRLNNQIETLQSHNHELETRCRQTEKDLEIAKNRVSEYEICNEKMREELRGFESRCHRLQNTIDRSQSERVQFLRSLASIVDVPEPCETLIKDKVNELINENHIIQAQLHNLRDQLATETSHYKESLETTNCRLKSEEARKNDLEERLERANAELQDIRSEHISLGEFLVRLAKAISWNECTSPPAQGPDTTILAESLLDRVERLASHHQHHSRACDKNCDHNHHHHHHHHTTGTKLRRERSYHDIPLKECSSLFNLQRRVRVLREQLSRRDLHLELLRRKIALLEENSRAKSALQSERDDAVNRAKRISKQTDKLATQLVEAKKQITDLKTQLAEAAEHKISALERARKIDELTARLCDIENEKSHLQAQVSTLKQRVHSTTESLQEKKYRNETLINTLRDDICRLKAQLSDANHRLSHLQTFRASVARTLHLRDIPETDLLHRLQQLCNAYQEFTLLSKRYESASPIGDHLCNRFEDILIPSSNNCRPSSSESPRHRTLTNNQRSNRASQTNNNSDRHHKNNRNSGSATLPRRCDSHNSHTGNCRNYDEHHFDDEFDFNKKFKDF